MALIKAIIAGMLAGTMCYCVITGIPIPEELAKIGGLVLAVYFGYSAKLYHDSERVRGQIDAEVAEALRRLGRDK